jgi:hypothetical protein
MGVGLVLAMALAVPRPASAQTFKYAGVDATNGAVHMELTLTGLGAGLFDATGDIWLPNFNPGTRAYSVKGIYDDTVGTMMAMVASALPASGAAGIEPVDGTLAGGILGTSPLDVTVLAPVWFGPSVGFLTPTFMLASLTPPPPPPPPPMPMDFSGSAAFDDTLDQAHLGRTQVDLNVHFQPQGALFSVSGQVTVTAQNQTSVFPVSGSYDPNAVPATGVPLAVANTPAGSNVVLTCTRKDPKTLAAALAGSPDQFFGVYLLFLNCQAP